MADYPNCTVCCDPGVSTPCCAEPIPSVLTASDGAGGSVAITWDGATGWTGTAVGSFAGCDNPTVDFRITCTPSFNIFLGVLYVNGTGSTATTPTCSPFDYSSTLNSPCGGTFSVSVTE